MYQGQAILGIEVRVRVRIGLVAVRGPAGVTNANKIVMLALAFVTESLDAVATVPVTRCELMNFKLTIFSIDRDDAAGVVASGLQNLQTIHAYVSGNWLVADVANDSAALVGLLGLSCCSVHVRCHGSEAHERFGLMPRFGASLAPTQIPVQVVQKSPLALERSTQQVLRDEPSVCLGSQSGIHKCLVAKR